MRESLKVGDITAGDVVIVRVGDAWHRVDRWLRVERVTAKGMLVFADNRGRLAPMRNGYYSALDIRKPSDEERRVRRIDMQLSKSKRISVRIPDGFLSMDHGTTVADIPEVIAELESIARLWAERTTPAPTSETPKDGG